MADCLSTFTFPVLVPLRFLPLPPLPSPNSPFLSLPFLALPVLSAAIRCCVSLPLPGPFPAFFSACLPSSFSSSLPVSLFLCLSVTVSHSLFLSSSLSSFSHLGFPPSLLVSLRLSFCLFPSLVCRSLGHPFFFPGTSVSLSFCLSVSLSLSSFVPSALDPQTRVAKKPCTAG